MVCAGGLIPYDAPLFMEHLSKSLFFAMNEALEKCRFWMIRRKNRTQIHECANEYPALEVNAYQLTYDFLFNICRGRLGISLLFQCHTTRRTSFRNNSDFYECAVLPAGSDQSSFLQRGTMVAVTQRAPAVPAPALAPSSLSIECFPVSFSFMTCEELFPANCNPFLLQQQVINAQAHIILMFPRNIEQAFYFWNPEHFARVGYLFTFVISLSLGKNDLSVLDRKNQDRDKVNQSFKRTKIILKNKQKSESLSIQQNQNQKFTCNLVVFNYVPKSLLSL